MHNTAVQLKGQDQNSIIYGAPEGQDIRILAEKARALMPKDKVLLHVALDDARLATLESLLEFFAPDVSFLSFPAWDCLPYDRISPHHDICARRAATLSRLMLWEKERKRRPRILLTTVNALCQRVVPRTALEQGMFYAAVNEKIDADALMQYLARSGYIKSETVREQGEFARRGGIIDLFPSDFEDPVRLDLFGDQVESIRIFDAMSQTSKEKIRELTLFPAGEIFLDNDSVTRFRKGYRESFGVVKDNDPLYAAISEGRSYNGMHHWQPLFFDRMETLFDYVPGAGITADQHAFDAYHERIAQIKDFYEARQTLKRAALSKKKSGNDEIIYHPLPLSGLYLDEEAWSALTARAQSLSPFGAPEAEAESGHVHAAKKARDFADIRALPDGDIFTALRDYLVSFRQSKLIACYSAGSLERLKGMLEAAGFEHLKRCENYSDIKALKGHELGLCVLMLERGFEAPDLVVVSEQDILGDRLARKSKKKRKADNFLKEVTALDQGDLVVHIDHGVGKFIALETLEAAGTLHDCLKIEYAGGDRLFVPVENIEVLSRFGSDEGAVQLDKLGGAGWQARKAKVKKDLMAMADQLLGIAAARKLKKAERIEADAGLYNEFAARFPYQETEDQERAIQDVLSDLVSPYPMDRLVCGDVGFGKTEVAIRAAYVAAMQGVQVAVVVPTTLLARQHFNNFVKRFENTGLRVEQLSRMVSAADRKSIKEGLADGRVNIVIGTHALFSKDIGFDNLGLLIIDEEQRFGVKHKERLKELKSNVHVLTLTATPIPRTLQMSLTGVKEMSLITTPPVDRLAIRTFILPFDPMVIREAILREHYRGGQSFYVCPRIRDMEEVEKELKALVPEVRLVAAHGQLSATELEDRMTAFYDGQYDVLLATNIIENGIDIPRANTMIVHRADMFGLAQLYQIRGRIGRSKVRAYAYLTYPPHQKLNPSAQKRLEVMETLDTLGSGFQLASHDMDIRGAGNLLGDQQSGHIKEVGVELYQQMLEDAVAAAREGGSFEDVPDKGWSPQINLGMSVLIPESYVGDFGVRMSLYRRLAELIEEDDVERFAAELIDRFGDLPGEVENLLSIVRIKQLCKKAGISEVEAGPKGAVLRFYNDATPDVEGLMRWIQNKGASVKLRPDQKLVVIRQWDSVQQRVKAVQMLMKELAGLKA